MTQPQPILNPDEIPGMIEPVEQSLLFSLAQTIALKPGDSIVEFGCFFGRSTTCLVNGVLARQDLDGEAPRLFAYDSFACDQSGTFAQYVAGFAKHHGLSHLLETRAGMLRFRKVFDTFLERHQQSGLVRVLETELHAMQCVSESIALMHIDAPKNYTELKHVIDGFFTKLHPGSIIVFQDYLYHWSGTLIAAVQIMIEMGVLSATKSAASSLEAAVLLVPTPEMIKDIDQRMTDCDVPSLIDKALQVLDPKTIDRPDLFIPRLHLAKIPYQWREGDYKAAQKSLHQALSIAKDKASQSFQDFSDLFGHGFNYDEEYSADHPQ